jgi:hypothetical protein
MPHYSTICRRINRLEIKIENGSIEWNRFISKFSFTSILLSDILLIVMADILISWKNLLILQMLDVKIKSKILLKRLDRWEPIIFEKRAASTCSWHLIGS